MQIENEPSFQELLTQISTPIFAIKKDEKISFIAEDINNITKISLESSPDKIVAYVPPIGLKDLGDTHFKKRHGIKFAYIAGAMANGIASAEMVKTMADHEMLGFFGAGGLSIAEIEINILTLKQSVNTTLLGFNLIHSLGDPAHEMATVNLYLKHDITLISAAAFMRMTPALVYYRIKGIYQDQDGQVIAPNRIIAKVSRIEIARQFFAPPPEKLVNKLLLEGLISQNEATLSQRIPMAQDLTAEADSGGHTDNRPALSLLPTMLSLKNEFKEKYKYQEPLCVGLAGGIATPESAAAAFGMGAGYILTGSINQSCVEAGICDDVKKMLCQAEQADVTMAPAADMFEIGAKVQVLKRGTMFPVRAEKLYKLYQNHSSFYEIDEKVRTEIENKFLLSSFEDAWKSTKDFFIKTGNPKEVEKASTNERYKMALVFRSYLGQSSKWAIQGVENRKMDYQIWCGPAIGAFNQWVKGSHLEPAKNRKTADIALNLLYGACLCTRISILNTQGVTLPSNLTETKPIRREKILTYI